MAAGSRRTPDHGAVEPSPVESTWPPAVLVRKVRVGVAGALRPPPPLSESPDVGIVERHLPIDAENRPAELPQPNAEIGLLASNHGLVEARYLREGRNPNQSIASA